MVDILIRKAKRDEELIEKMRGAILAGDKDLVFILSKELTCVMNAESNWLGQSQHKRTS